MCEFLRLNHQDFGRLKEFRISLKCAIKSQANETGYKIDATKEQYTMENKTPPYDKGKKKWFLTNKPSKRSEELFNRIKTAPE